MFDVVCRCVYACRCEMNKQLMAEKKTFNFDSPTIQSEYVWRLKFDELFFSFIDFALNSEACDFLIFYRIELSQSELISIFDLQIKKK